jgi:hypothetical protein
MAKPVTLKLGQYLLLIASLFLVGAGSGITGAGLYWHVHGFVTLSAPVEILGLLAFIVLAIWRSVDNWAARTGGRPLGY